MDAESAFFLSPASKDLGVFLRVICEEYSLPEQAAQEARAMQEYSIKTWRGMKKHSCKHIFYFGGRAKFKGEFGEDTACDVQLSQAGVSCCERLAMIQRKCDSDEWILFTDRLMSELGLVTVNGKPPVFIDDHSCVNITLKSGDNICILGNKFKFEVRRPWEPEFEGDEQSSTGKRAKLEN